jgi:hypothetical protein
MSDFYCKVCGTSLIYSPTGHITGCVHFPKVGPVNGDADKEAMEAANPNDLAADAAYSKVRTSREGPSDWDYFVCGFNAGHEHGWDAAKSHFAPDDREKLRSKIEDLIGEFGDHPDLCLGAIIEYLTRPKGEHSINADGSCNLGCC